MKESCLKGGDCCCEIKWSDNRLVCLASGELWSLFHGPINQAEPGGDRRLRGWPPAHLDEYIFQVSLSLWLIWGSSRWRRSRCRSGVHVGVSSPGAMSSALFFQPGVLVMQAEAHSVHVLVQYLHHVPRCSSKCWTKLHRPARWRTWGVSPQATTTTCAHQKVRRYRLNHQSNNN